MEGGDKVRPDSDSVVIEGRFHGPPNSANGGYCCGRLAAFVGGPATVRLHEPPPLDTPLALEREGERVALVYGGHVIASARPGGPDIDAPEAPAFEAAQAAEADFRGHHRHPFPSCFVCGPARRHGDGLRLFAGPLGDGGTVAAHWMPDAGLADAEGRVRDEFLWAALDCPGAYAFDYPDDRAVLLGELSAEILRPVRVGEACVVAGWEIRTEGRRHWSGTAVYDGQGRCAAIARATWFEVPVADVPQPRA